MNEWSIKLSQEAEKSIVLKERLEKHIKKLQKTVKKLERRDYNLEREDRVLRELVGDYKGQNKFLKGFILIMFILGQLVVGLYLLGFFDGNNVCVTIF